VLDRARLLAQWIAPTQRHLQRLTLSEQYAWTAELTGGLVLELGRDALATPVEERVRMFVKTQPWLAQRLGSPGEPPRLARADLRYAIGYAFVPLPAGAEISPLGADPTPLCIGVHT
jgi:cell division septal protein FtsQ